MSREHQPNLRVTIDHPSSERNTVDAANEAAVEAFLARRIPFGRLAELSCASLDEVGVSPVRDLTDIIRADSEARRYVRASIEGAGVA